MALPATLSFTVKIIDIGSESLPDGTFRFVYHFVKQAAGNPSADFRGTIIQATADQYAIGQVLTMSFVQ